MLTITKREHLVLSQIKILQNNFPKGVPLKILRSETELRGNELKEVLDFLESKNMLSIENNYITLKENDVEIKTVKTKKEAKEIALNQKEKNALELIKTLLNKNKEISRYRLEGELLYGEEKISNFRMYHIILSLENKKKIERVKRKDGEYYRYIE